ncbi:MAG: NAD-dependent epimerase/dehydratase family protein [Chloroflexota bacterium]
MGLRQTDHDLFTESQSLPTAAIFDADDVVLVTGAGGFLGGKVVESLLSAGFRRVRCFVRPTSAVGRLRTLSESFPEADLELSVGTLLDRVDCVRAVADARAVINCAAGMRGSLHNMFVDSVLASRNLLDAVVASEQVLRVVHVSSFAVYRSASLRRGETVTEETALETRHDLRNDSYSFTKHKQESLFWIYSEQYGLPLVVVRPGVVFGPGGTEISTRVGVRLLGTFLEVGGNNPIPLTYVGNCAEAIVLAATKPGIDGNVFNIHDDCLPTCREFFNRYRKSKGRMRYVRVPYPVMRLLSFAIQRYSEHSAGQIPPALTPYKAASLWNRTNFSNSKAKKLLGWSPRVPMEEALKLHFDAIGPGYY